MTSILAPFPVEDAPPEAPAVPALVPRPYVTPEPPAAVPASPYQTGARVLEGHPHWRYLVSGEPVRPPTEEEAKEYAARAADPEWAAIYRPPDAAEIAAAPVAEPEPEDAGDAIKTAIANRYAEAWSGIQALPARWASGETRSEDERESGLSMMCLHGRPDDGRLGSRPCEGDCPHPAQCACDCHERDAAEPAPGDKGPVVITRGELTQVWDEQHPEGADEPAPAGAPPSEADDPEPAPDATAVIPVADQPTGLVKAVTEEGGDSDD